MSCYNIADKTVYSPNHVYKITSSLRNIRIIQYIGNNIFKEVKVIKGYEYVKKEFTAPDGHTYYDKAEDLGDISSTTWKILYGDQNDS